MFNITLRWRITLLTMAVMLVSSISLIVFININTNRVLPHAADAIIRVGSVTTGMQEGDVTGGEGISPGRSPDMAGTMGTQISSYAVVDALDTAAKELYWGSLFLLLVAIILGGACAYFVSDRALRPVRIFSESIKRVNAHNLASYLPVDGPEDEIREMAMSFNAMLAKLENAFSSQKRFNASMAHELKTPLAVIKTNIDILNDLNEEDIEHYKHTLGVVEQSVIRMNASVEAMLDTVQQENADLEDEVDLTAILTDIAEDVKLLAEEKEILLYSDIQPVPVMQGNEILLYRAVYNVVENAIKYTPAQGTVTLSCDACGQQVVIQVSDTGRGISEKEIQNIFEPFYRGRQCGSQNGLGLGLALTKAVIVMHCGEISVKSELGTGSVFEIKLPIQQNRV